MISIAPGERVPRHRLIHNLIEAAQWDVAETEMRVFERDLGRDGPVARYRISLLISRALYTRGLSDSDRKVILDQARAEALAALDRYPNNRSIYAVYADIGLQLIRVTGEVSVIDDALDRMSRAEVRLADPDVTKMIRAYERRKSNELAMLRGKDSGGEAALEILSDTDLPPIDE